MNVAQIIFLVISLSGFSYGLYCQFQARKYVSKEKIQQLKDTSMVASGVMPPKEIISEEGLKYYKGFILGAFLFISGLVLFILLVCLK